MITSGGKAEWLRVEHCWVEVNVAYVDYRGAGSGTGPRSWIPLDASFKQYREMPRVQVATSGVDPGQLLSAVSSGAIATSDSVTAIDLNATRDALRAASATLAASMATTPSVEQILGLRSVVRAGIGSLPPVPPWSQIDCSGEWRAVPGPEQDRIRVQFPGGTAFETPLAGAADQRLTVSFVGATEQDLDILSGYSGLGDVPAYLVEVKPRLALGGRAVSEGEPAALGTPIDVKLSMSGAQQEVAFSSTVITGGFYSLVLNTGHASVRSLAAHAGRCETEVAALQAVASGDASAQVDAGALMGELFHASGLVYFTQLDAAYQMLAGPWRVAQVRHPSEATVGTSLSLTSVLGAVSGVRPTGVSIDVRRDAHVVQSETDDPKMEVGYMTAIGGIGSYLEGRMIEQVYGLEGISTVRILQIANNSRIPIYAIDRGNAEEIDQLNYGESLKADLRDAVSAGMQVTIPRNGIEYYGFRGTGWIVHDPTTGAGGYMIDGGLAGGRSTHNAGGSDGSGGSAWDFEGTAYASDMNGPTSPASGSEADLALFDYVTGALLVAATFAGSGSKKALPWQKAIAALTVVSAAKAAYDGLVGYMAHMTASNEGEFDAIMALYAIQMVIQAVTVVYVGASVSVGSVQANLLLASASIFCGLAIGFVENLRQSKLRDQLRPPEY
jgi:hypothetical protein